MLQNELFDNVMQDFNAGYWKLNEVSGIEMWSSVFYEKLGYEIGSFPETLNYFLETLIHEADKKLFRNNFLMYQRKDINFEQHIRILNSIGDYQSFRCNTNDQLPINIQSSTKLLFFMSLAVEPERTLVKSYFYYQETAEMTETGSWYVDFKKKKSFWDFQTYKMMEYPEDHEPSIKDSANYYAKECRQQAATLFFNCAVAGVPFSTEIKMLTAKGNIFWARAIGKPVYNDLGNIVGIRGVFQSIEELKKKELGLEKSIDIIESQNKRLFNFAHIVSHNLRSHTSNLSLLVQLIENIADPQEKAELIDDIKKISESLNTTIEHLNEVATIQTNKKQKRVLVYFKDTLRVIRGSISHILKSGNATVEADFSGLESVNYIPAYLESIMLNLITNAVKYKDPNRDVVIKIKTYINEGKKYMEVADNGSGIDLELFGDKIFGMYKTFHYNEDAVGIGLFITKNQIESLNGTISLTSEVGLGTTFTIAFG